MLNLIAKDFKLLFKGKGTLTNRILTFIFYLVIATLFIYIEIKIFGTILNKIKAYSGAANAFFTIFLFILNILLTFLCLFTAKKLFFDNSDIITIGPYPISSGKRIASKLIFLFLITTFFNLLFTLPIFIAYGITFKRGLTYYYSCIYYPICIFLFQGGIALLLLMPYKALSDYLSKHIFIQLLVVIIIGFSLAFLYGYVLNLFTNIVSNSKFDSLFTRERLDNIVNVSKNLFPVNFLSDVFLKHRVSSFFPFIAFNGGIFVIGLSLAIYFYHKFLYLPNNENKKKKAKKEKVLKIHKVFPSLIKKELIILFRNSNYIITFTGLLFIEPILSYFVIDGLNVIFKNGTLAYYALAIPDLIPIMDFFILLLLMAIVFSSGTNYISNENKNIRVIKTIPVSIYKQLLAKALIPYLSVLFFSLLSIMVLLISTQINFINALFAFIYSIFFLLLLTFVGLYEELKIKRNGARNYLYSTLSTYLIPIISFFMMMLFSYFKINIVYSYLLILAILLILFLPFVIKGKFKFEKWFLEMEVIN